MAFFNNYTQLQALNVAQMDALTVQRQLTGFHIFFTNGLNAHGQTYQAYFPTNFLPGAVFTTFFRFTPQKPPKSGEVHQCILAKRPSYFGKYVPAEVYITLGFSDKYTLKKKDGPTDPEVDHQVPQALTTPVQGLHVLQYKRTIDGIEVLLDGVLLAPPNVFNHKDLEEFINFKTTRELRLSRFHFYENHFTIDDVVTAFQRKTFHQNDFGFKHESASFFPGGYAMWSGQWLPNTLFIVYVNGGQIASIQVPPTGSLVAILKFYDDTVLLKDANPSNASKPVTATWQYPRVYPLGCTPPTSFTELKYVTGASWLI